MGLCKEPAFMPPPGADSRLLTSVGRAGRWEGEPVGDQTQSSAALGFQPANTHRPVTFLQPVYSLASHYYPPIRNHFIQVSQCFTG